MKMLISHLAALKDLLKDVIQNHYVDQATTTVADWLAIKEFEYRTSGHSPDRKLKDLLYFARKRNPEGFANWYRDVDQYCREEHVLTAMRKVWDELATPENAPSRLGYFVDWDGIVRSADCPGDSFKSTQTATGTLEIVRRGEVMFEAQRWMTLADLEAAGIKVKLHQNLLTNY